MQNDQQRSKFQAVYLVFSIGILLVIGSTLLKTKSIVNAQQRPSRPSRTGYQPSPSSDGNSPITLSRPARPQRGSSCKNCQLAILDSSGRYLVSSYTNKPVFCTGDSPQLLPVQISQGDADIYLADRQARGFNCFWVYPVNNYDQDNAPHNYYGNVPFNGADFTNENEAYWSYVDTLLTDMSNRGMIAFFQTAFVGIYAPGGYINSILSSSDATLQAYGAWLGNRYKNYDNIIWVLGGDANTSQSGLYSKLADIAVGLQSTDPNHLITLEACRSCDGSWNQSSLDAYGGTPPSWLKVNWAYADYNHSVAACNNAYAAANYLPPVMGEDFYELDTRVTAAQVRQEGWWEATSGCTAGRLFGNLPIWTFNSSVWGFTSPTWQSQLSSTASIGEQYLGTLMRGREFWLCAPDVSHTVLTANYGAGATLTTTCRTTDGQSIISYFSDGNATTKLVDMTKIVSSSNQVKAWWYNPQTGAASAIGTYANSGSRTFVAPDGNDWVLVLDDASAPLAVPGQ